jgi:hypothetical protein
VIHIEVIAVVRALISGLAVRTCVGVRRAGRTPPAPRVPRGATNPPSMVRSS